MRRTFYVALGATAGVLIVRRLSRVANKWTPEGLAAQAGGLGDRFAAFWAEVQTGAAEREEELRSALGLDGRHDDVDSSPWTGDYETGGPR
jgi:hypothetical protein